MTHRSSFDDDQQTLSHLLQLCQDLQLSLLTPAAVASQLCANRALRHSFAAYLPLLLDANTFALSPILGQVLQRIDDISLVHNVKFQNPSLATVSLMLTIPATFLPSELLQRIQRNALMLQGACQWSHVKIATAVQNALQHCVVLPENSAILPRKPCLLPDADRRRFMHWFNTLSRVQVAHLYDLVAEINAFDDASSIMFLCFAYDDSRASADAFDKAILQISETLTDEVDMNQTRVHSYLVQLVDLISASGTDPCGHIDWKTIAIAFAILYRYSNCADKSAWWSSILVALRYVQASETANHADFMFVVPFASAQCPSVQLVTQLFFLISANDEITSLYTALRFLRAMDKRILEENECLSFMSSCLPLSDQIFNQTIHLVDRSSA